MSNQKIQEEKIPSFKKSAIIHGIFGILEYAFILITILVYVKNLPLLLTNIIIISGLFLVLSYTIFFKNPYYYISLIGLVFITIFPSAIAMMLYIGSTPWSYDLIRIFIIFVLVVEVFYIYFLIREISDNKHLRYFHKKYGYLWSTASFMLRGSYYSVREFDKLNKGRQVWQDHDPEEIRKKREELKNYEKRFRKKLLILIQVIAVIAFIVSFGISLMV